MNTSSLTSVSELGVQTINKKTSHSLTVIEAGEKMLLVERENIQKKKKTLRRP
jgi:hypothetical protein